MAPEKNFRLLKYEHILQSFQPVCRILFICVSYSDHVTCNTCPGLEAPEQFCSSEPRKSNCLRVLLSMLTSTFPGSINDDFDKAIVEMRVKQLDLETVAGGENIDVKGVALSYTFKYIFNIRPFCNIHYHFEKSIIVQIYFVLSVDSI